MRSAENLVGDRLMLINTYFQDLARSDIPYELVPVLQWAIGRQPKVFANTKEWGRNVRALPCDAKFLDAAVYIGESLPEELSLSVSSDHDATTMRTFAARTVRMRHPTTLRDVVEAVNQLDLSRLSLPPIDSEEDGYGNHGEGYVWIFQGISVAQRPGCSKVVAHVRLCPENEA